MSDIILDKLEELDRRFDIHDRRFDAHDRRFDAHDRRFDAHDLRFDAQDRRLDAHEERLDRIETELHRQGVLQEAHEQKTTRVLEVVLGMAERMERWEPLEQKVAGHEHRLSALELAYKAEQ